jgi:hypothetical protein
VGDRWLADKGFMVQHILDAYGVIVDTTEKLSNKKQFTYKNKTYIIERILRFGYMSKERYEESRCSGFLKKTYQFDMCTRFRRCGTYIAG